MDSCQDSCEQDVLNFTRQTLDDFQVQYLNPDDTPVDLTGYTAKIEIRDQRTNEVALTLLSSTMTGSRIVITPLTGTVQVIMITADTNTIPAGSYKYDLALILGGEVERPVRGEMIFDDYVTDVL